MEDKKLNEKESLELITKMIEATKQNVVKQDFNPFLIYGYLAVILSVLIYGVVYYTHNGQWSMLWMLMFLPYLFTMFGILQKSRQTQSDVVTYMEQMTTNIWRILGSLFGLTFLVMCGLGYFIGRIDFSLMLPLSLIFGCIGTSMTGLVIKEKWLIFPPFIGFIVAIYMLMTEPGTNEWNLWFGLSFLFFMVIPGHVLRHKNH